MKKKQNEQILLEKKIPNTFFRQDNAYSSGETYDDLVWMEGWGTDAVDGRGARRAFQSR